MEIFGAAFVLLCDFHEESLRGGASPLDLVQNTEPMQCDSKIAGGLREVFLEPAELSVRQ